MNNVQFTGLDERTVRDILNDVNEIRVLKRNGFRGVTKPVCVYLPGTTAQTAANYTTPFFIADRAYEVLEVTERHEAAASGTGSVTVLLVKVPSETAPASGTRMFSGEGFNIGTTSVVNKNVTFKQSGTISVKLLETGSSLSLIGGGTLAGVQGVSVSVLLRAL